MFDLAPDLGRTAAAPLWLLCLGAHADDIEIGAGGTVLRLLAERPHTRVTWAVATGGAEPADRNPADREAEARAAAAAILGGAAEATVEVGAFRDGFLPTQAAALKEWAQERLEGARPALVLTHRADDAHQDHRAVADLAWQTFRGATIAAFEVPKWDGDLAPPNAYVALDADVLERKVRVLREHFPSQRAKPWFDNETFRGLARLRGVEAGVRYAEAFHVRKLVW